jgi:aspartate 4-decarboxylase
MIAKLPQKQREALRKRYGPITLQPDKLKFIDRIMADSRDIALNHTAGLSLPQQVQMTLFSLFQLMDEDLKYQKASIKIVQDRALATIEGLGIDLKPGPLFSGYYGLVDIEFWLRKYVGDEVLQFIKQNYHPLDIVYRLAADHAIVLLNGSGFAAPDWSVRISFANLNDDVYDDIGRAVRAVARSYVEAYHFANKNGTAKEKANGAAGGKGTRAAHR